MEVGRWLRSSVFSSLRSYIYTVLNVAVGGRILLEVYTLPVLTRLVVVDAHVVRNGYSIRDCRRRCASGVKIKLLQRHSHRIVGKEKSAKLLRGSTDDFS